MKRRDFVFSAAAMSMVSSPLLARSSPQLAEFLSGKTVIQGGIELDVDIFNNTEAVGVTLSCPGAIRLGLFTGEPEFPVAFIAKIGPLAEPKISTRIRLKYGMLTHRQDFLIIGVGELSDGTVRMIEKATCTYFC